VWVRGLFRKEILAAVSVAMIILGLVMQLGGSQSALAHSIGQLKVILSISAGLDRAASMECVVQKRAPKARKPHIESGGAQPAMSGWIWIQQAAARRSGF